jgi:alginate O-acetyltransferase complex protein AlgI
VIFTELRFFGFFLLVFALHWALQSRSARHAVLLAASYVFYGAWDVRFLGLIMLSTAVDYTAALLLSGPRTNAQRRSILAVTLGFNLGLLGVFKYFNFFADSLVTLLNAFGFAASQPTLRLILPVGISFYTFQSLSYTIDVYRGQLRAEKNPFTYALFVAFFPQLVAGPIVRAVDFLPQLARTPSFAAIAWRPLLLLFLWGYGKKAVLSDNLAPYVDAFFASPATFDTAAHWLGVMLYAAQIYCDFSGYSDMAIATAGLLGYQLCRNFDHPYVSCSPREFWRRWHISLSTWLRDYVYIPLGGNRGGPSRVATNLMLTMLVGGLWHGAAWTFVAWGALHGAALVVDHLWHAKNKTQPPAPPSLTRAIAGWCVTMLLVLVGWVFFRATDFSNALAVLRGLSGAEFGADTLPVVLWLYLVAAFAVHLFAARGFVSSLALERLPWPRFAVVYGVLTGATLLFVNTSYRAFIYFQF